MNVIWLLILFFGISAMLFTNPDGAIKAMLTGANNSVTLALNLVATYGFWLGFFGLLERTGISEWINKIIRPLIRFLFPNISKESEKYVSLNISANLLGLGNASTPMGIKAINSMYDGKMEATTNMIMLTVISATSLQIIPSTVIGMRIAHGSAFPTSFLFPSIVATVVSTITGVLLVKLLSRITKKDKKKHAVFMRAKFKKGKNAV
jgi:spore maturation protein A